MILNCYVDDRTRHILERVSATTGRSLEELAEAAIEEAAIRELPHGVGDRQRTLQLSDHWCLPS